MTSNLLIINVTVQISSATPDMLLSYSVELVVLNKHQISVAELIWTITIINYCYIFYERDFSAQLRALLN